MLLGVYRCRCLEVWLKKIEEEKLFEMWIKYWGWRWGWEFVGGGSWQTVSFIPRRNSNKTRQCFHWVAAPCFSCIWLENFQLYKCKRKVKHVWNFINNNIWRTQHSNMENRKQKMKNGNRTENEKIENGKSKTDNRNRKLKTEHGSSMSRPTCSSQWVKPEICTVFFAEWAQLYAV